MKLLTLALLSCVLMGCENSRETNLRVEFFDSSGNFASAFLHCTKVVDSESRVVITQGLRETTIPITNGITYRVITAPVGLRSPIQ